MSYCNINDAFENINYKLINEGDKNIVYKNNIFENVNKSTNFVDNMDDLMGTNLSNFDSGNSPEPDEWNHGGHNVLRNNNRIHTKQAEQSSSGVREMSIERNPADFEEKKFQRNSPERSSKEISNGMSPNNISRFPQDKLTHRECIRIYYNPEKNKNSSIDGAMKHISKCDLCKTEIKKLNLLYNTPGGRPPVKNSQEQSSTGSPIDKQLKMLNDSVESLRKEFLSESTGLRSSQNSPGFGRCLSDKSRRNPPERSSEEIPVNKENNLKYQNMELQNLLSKYLEDAGIGEMSIGPIPAESVIMKFWRDSNEEKKILNNKLDKILEVISSSAKYPLSLNDAYPSFQNNAHRFVQQNATQNQNSDSLYIVIGMCIIMVLLIVDIVMRFGQNRVIA